MLNIILGRKMEERRSQRAFDILVFVGIFLWLHSFLKINPEQPWTFHLLLLEELQKINKSVPIFNTNSAVFI